MTRVITTIDTEEAWDWSGSYPTRDFSVKHIDRLPEFQALCDRHGIRSTYFTNHAVMNDARAAAVMQSIAGGGNAEVGMHIHPWATPPIDEQRAVTSRDTYLHNAAPELIRTKLQVTYDALKASGITPTSFRGGRYSSGGVIHEFLRANRFVADCSVVPFTRWDEEGSPDFRERDIYPTRLTPRSGNEAALWEIPLSMGFSRTPFKFWAPVFRLVETSVLGKLRLIGIAERLGLVRKVWLNFEINDPHDWTPFMLLLQRLEVPVITFTVHSSSLFAGPGPYTRNAADEARIFGQMERVFDTVRNLPGFESVTATEAAHFLEKQHASSGH
jgi:hypothetical protein